MGELTPQLARAIIRSLTRGTTVREGVPFLHVGHDRWLAAQAELLREVSEDGYSDTKFVRGAYGSGKSHFLAMVQHRARAAGWVCAHVECMHDNVEIDRFETLYPKVWERLSWEENGQLVGADSGGDAAPSRLLLDKWAAAVHARAGIKKDSVRRPFDADHRVYGELERTLLRTNIGADASKALLAYARASLDRDADTCTAIVQWIAGGTAPVAIARRYLRAPQAQPLQDQDQIVLRPVGKGSAREALRGLLWIVRNTGHAGLLLCIDEIEELAKLSSRKRQDQALQALREYVDNAGGDGAYRHLAMYLAATPEMFDSRDYFPRYDALATRIQAVGSALNWRAPVIDLDRTALDRGELVKIAKKIVSVHETAFEGASELIPKPFIEALIEELSRTRLRFAKPRLLARVIVDELERARQDPTAYSAPDPKEAVIETGRRLEAELRA